MIHSYFINDLDLLYDRDFDHFDYLNFNNFDFLHFNLNRNLNQPFKVSVLLNNIFLLTTYFHHPLDQSIPPHNNLPNDLN